MTPRRPQVQAREPASRVAPPMPGPDAPVSGRSHVPGDPTAPSGLRLLTPGSPPGRGRQPHGSYVTAVADDGQLRDVTFHAVPPRS